MKKIFTLGLISLLSLSCSKDDESTTTGTYILTSITTEDALDFNNDGVFSRNYLSETNCSSNSKVILSENGAMIIQLQIANANLNNPGGTDNTYTIDCSEPSAFNGTWVEAGPNLLLTIENESETFIKNGNSISYYSADIIEYLENFGGSTIVKSTGATLIFTKI